MGCGRDKSSKGCVCQAVRAIKDIQDAANQECNDCKNDCFLEPLGSMVSPTNRLNTRIFKLYLKNGETFKAHIKGCPWKSPFFRVKEVFDNCCATLQVLKPDYAESTGSTSSTSSSSSSTGSDMDSMGNNTEWVFTDECITVDLDCFCAIQCIKDVHVFLECEE
ncbi:CotY/CotZ family spore coat protein [Bacillus sp. KH172YL63]|uniref:CotY/CotZ family spore coat protein n=1 Tax=Bacillus sp. KH172YL63 TaxID=2709784 RepID=UPI0013E5241A|nr:CotY/CotZ family spore coat protein [Bacillus sp. KH172YL63]BCB03063.1 spore coat protein [Bacillus sp. KH172YL63]